MNRIVYLYVGVSLLVSLALLAWAPWGTPASVPEFWNCLIALGVLAFAAESAFLRLPVGSVTSSVAFVPYLASIVLLGPGWSMLIAGATETIVETAIRKKPPIKVLFNASNHVMATGFAGIVYVSLGGTWSATSFELAEAAFMAAAAVFFLTNAGGTVVVITLSTGSELRRTWQRVAGGSLLFDFLASPLALLLAFLYVRAELIGILVVGVPLFLVRHILAVNLKLEEVNRDLLELMVKAIEARDPYTSGHSLRVSKMSGILARELGLSIKQVDQIETAALLHDVGKIYEEYAPILRKPGKLSTEERALMKTHSIRSYELVRTISGFRNGVDAIVRHHHENYDGTGYPDGVGRKDIPFGSRIIMVADTIDAMTTDRPYRSALSVSDVISELEKYKGTQFDPDVVDAFVRSASARVLLEASRVAAESLSHDVMPREQTVHLAVQ